MKNTIYIGLAFVLAFSIVSCDDAIPEEQYEKYILLNQNGFVEYELDFVNSNIKDTTIAVAVSGTSKLANDITVNIGINPDTLAGYNFDKYRYEEVLYLQLLPEDCYEFDSLGIVLKAGTEYVEVPIRFYLDRIDKNRDYVLPISIKSVSDLQIADQDYCTLLMHITLTNEYSGSYTLKATLIEEDLPDEEFILTMENRLLRVVDNRSVYFYAGNVAENNPDRELYRVEMTINADSSLSFRSVDPRFEIKPADINLSLQTPVNRMVVRKDTDVTNTMRTNVTTIFYVTYSYTDKSIPESPVTVYLNTGTMTRLKIVTNTN